MRAALAFFGLLFVCTVGGVAQNTTHPQSANTVAYQKQIDALNATVTTLRQQLLKLESKQVMNDFLMTLKQDKQDEVMLDISSHEFDRLDTATGPFLILLQDVAPYLNGYKIIVKIGNPSSAEFANATVTIKWAKKYVNGTPYDEWQKTVQTKEVELTSLLEPGSWNPVEFTLLPASADQLGYLSFSMKTKSVSLRTNSTAIAP